MIQRFRGQSVPIIPLLKAPPCKQAKPIGLSNHGSTRAINGARVTHWNAHNMADKKTKKKHRISGLVWAKDGRG